MTIILLSTWFGPEGWRAFQMRYPGSVVSVSHNAYRFKFWCTVCNFWVAQKFRNMGMKTIFVDLSDSRSVADDLPTCRILYIGGGNTRRLLKEITDGGCTEMILTHINQPYRAVVGSSAGAILLGKSIKPGDWLGDSQAITPNTMDGWNLLPCKGSVLPHDKEQYTTFIRDTSNGETLPIRRIKNSHSIFIETNGSESYYI